MASRPSVLWSTALVWTALSCGGTTTPESGPRVSVCEQYCTNIALCSREDARDYEQGPRCVDACQYDMENPLAAEQMKATAACVETAADCEAIADC